MWLVAQRGYKKSHAGFFFVRSHKSQQIKAENLLTMPQAQDQSVCVIHGPCPYCSASF